jgi:N-acetylglutamate synthase-like GNAT family acetyltransferase
MKDLYRFRAAKVEEIELLSELALRAKQFWGYDDNFIELCRPALTVSIEQLQTETFIVLQKQDQIMGFYSLHVPNETAELTNLFVDLNAIGSGNGKRLWQHAVETARSLGATKILIKSDPNAIGFYQAMGAEQIGEAPSEAKPGRMLPLLRFNLLPDVSNPSLASPI